MISFNGWLFVAQMSTATFAPEAATESAVITVSASATTRLNFVLSPAPIAVSVRNDTS